MHGLAFNISTDLAGFRLIVPCGIAQYGVTSLAALAAARAVAPAPSVEDVARASVTHFARVFEADATMAGVEEADEIGALLGAPPPR
jgi:lipoyl(octanoyl) transferase